MSELYQQQVRKLIVKGEGLVRHMYLDTVGKVTVGVGNLLKNAESACTHPFYHMDSETDASSTEITAEFNLVNAQAKGKLASTYKKYARLELSLDYIYKLLDKRIAGFEKRLRIDFPDYDNYPEEARLGLLDMAFNLGNTGLVKKFPSFTTAALKQDWKTCALECKRKGISKDRNDEVRELFLHCLGAAAD